MQRIRGEILSFPLSSCVLAAFLCGASPSGTATNASEAVAAKAAISAVHLETNARGEPLTKQAGNFEIPALPCGASLVTLEAGARGSEMIVAAGAGTTPLVSQASDVWNLQGAGEKAQENTVNDTAEFGRAGYVNLAAASGAHEFRGQAAFWNLNPAFAARRLTDASETRVLVHTILAGAIWPASKSELFFSASVNLIGVSS